MRHLSLKEIFKMSEKEKEVPRHEDVEIIEEHVVPTASSKFIKIRVKERISRKKHKKKLSLSLKITVILSAIILGLLVGIKVVSRYISHWKKPQIQHIPEDQPTQQLQAGQVYSIDQQ